MRVYVVHVNDYIYLVTKDFKKAEKRAAIEGYFKEMNGHTDTKVYISEEIVY